MKWGVISISIAITALLGLAAIIPYNQTVSFPIIIGNEHVTNIISHVSGRVAVNHLANAQRINKGDTLLVVLTPGQPDTYIISSISGFPIYSNKQVFNATQVETGDTLVKILPIIDPLNKVMAFGYFNGPFPRNPERVSIKLEEATGNTVAIKARIQYVSVVREPEKGHMIMIAADSNSLRALAGQTSLYQGMKAVTTVIVKQRTILQWIFE